MTIIRDRAREFDPIFFPKSIAVVGASADETKFGTGYLRALVKAGYQGKLYPVNSEANGGKAFGLDIYKSLRDVPGPVEFVIVAIPRNKVLELLDDGAAKGIKAIQFFTAGFSECGEPEWIAVEKEMVRKAKAGNFHIVGPNCVGVYSSANLQPLAFLPEIGPVGPVAGIAQSGGHSERILEYMFTRGIGMSKLVSMGNGSDLDSTDYLEYFANDPQTGMVCAYLEGVKNGRRFFELVREINKTKPVVIWKGGKTEAGAEAANSHTASLAASDVTWSAALRQVGATKVDSMEELGDTVQVLHHLKPFRGKRVAILAGLAGGGGGESVSSTDSCVSAGLEVLPFTDTTRDGLKRILRPMGTILRNPLDMGSVGGNLPVLRQVLNLVAADANVDIIIVNQNPAGILRMVPMERWQQMNEEFIVLARSQPKPVVSICYPGPADMERLAMEKKLREARIPFFPTLDRAARALANGSRYWNFRAGLG